MTGQAVKIYRYPGRALAGDYVRSVVGFLFSLGVLLMQPANIVVVLIFAVVILVPSMLGFVAKFIEFFRTFQGDASGAFAVTPMVNYLLATTGFLCLLSWATLNGMFHDIERPKHAMLEREQELDRLTAQGRRGTSP